MSKPIILALDDDQTVLRAVQRDLRTQYGKEYRIVAVSEGAKALEVLHELVKRGETAAFFLIDQRMPSMTGTQFLEQAMKIFPEAKRVLLTAYADTNAAIQAINEAQIDYYLMKPWDPPEEKLYPVLNDLLEDWQQNATKPYDGVQVIGHRFSLASHDIRDFLTRNFVPFKWLGADSDAGVHLLHNAEVDDTRLPVLVFPGRKVLVQPTKVEIAAQVGLKTEAELPFYDLVIIGGGPAGLAAAVYGGSEGLRTVMIERSATGGQAGQSSRIENYLGFPSGVSGADLARRATVQAKRLGAEILTACEVESIEARGPSRLVRLKDGTELAAHTVLIATGVSYRRLNAPGVDELTGRGIYYGAASSEAASYADQDVVVVGGANSAGQAALHFAQYARNVTLLYRGASLVSSMSHYLIQQIAQTKNVHVKVHSEVISARGEGKLESITIVEGGKEREIATGGLFVFIGAVPRTDWLEGIVDRNDRGFIRSGLQVEQNSRRENWQLDRDPFILETNVPGVFVAGDVREQSTKRVASAVGDGSMAVQFIHQYLGGLQSSA